MRNSLTAFWSLLLLFAVSAEVSAQQSIAWLTDVNQARQMAEQQNRPILLHFYADWCVPCRRLDRDVFPNNEVVKAISSNFIPVKVDIDKAKPLAQHFKVSRIPADVIVTAKGQVLYQGQSSMDAAVLVSALDGVVKQFGPAATTVAANTVVPTGSVAPTNEVAPNNNIATANTLAPNHAAPAINQVAPQQPVQNQIGSRNSGPQLNRGGSFQPANENLASNPQMQINPHVAPTQQPLQPPYAAQTQTPAPIEPHNPNTIGVNQPGLTLPPQQQLPPRQGLVTQPAAQPPAAQAPAPAPAAQPPAAQQTAPTTPIALDGFCPVTLIEKSEWIEANPQFGVIHRKRTYLFAGPEEQKKFLQDPDRFSPALSGFDPVRFVEEQRLVEGQRQFGVYYDDMIFLFADEQALNHFSQGPDKYVTFVRQAMGTKSPTQR